MRLLTQRHVRYDRAAAPRAAARASVNPPCSELRNGTTR
jgi:hypothetical protein